MPQETPGRLWIVATPIGHMDDISSRARKVLDEVDLIACEDTRHSGRLLTALGIDTPLISYHEHNESARTDTLLQTLKQGRDIALISDAGTPLVSDPGFRLVQAVADAGFDLVPVPGPSAVLAALMVAGLPTDRFRYLGFPPSASKARQDWYRQQAGDPDTQVYFESCHRLEESLADAAEVLGEDRPAVLCRELTKRFETVLRGSLGSLRDRVAADANQRKGEMVVVLGGSREEDSDQDLVRAVEIGAWLDEELPTGKAAKLAARITGVGRREIYQQLLQRAQQDEG